jgi:hypothetical protein
MYLRTTQATRFSTALVTLNNDTAGNYDLQRLQGLNASVSSGPGLAATAWTFDCPGTTVAANFFTVIRLTIPCYAQTNGNKIGEATQGFLDTAAAGTIAEAMAIGYRSTTAISRLKVAAGSGNLLAGSRLLIFGR